MTPHRYSANASTRSTLVLRRFESFFPCAYYFCDLQLRLYRRIVALIGGCNTTLHTNAKQLMVLRDFPGESNYVVLSAKRPCKEKAVYKSMEECL
jgi:hypothetical protein